MSPKIVNAAVVLILAALWLAIFANSMSKPVGRDEQMYCTAGVLLSQGRMIYRDFSYVAQMPYHALLCAALFKALDTTYYLLAGRILSVVCDILVVVCIVGIYRRIFGSFSISGALLGLAGAVLYVFNPLVDYANGFAWNNDVVVLCVAVSFWLFISVDFEKRSRYWRIALIGVLLSFATWMRMTMVVIQLLFFVILLIRGGRSSKERGKTVLPFLIATGLVSIWPIWTIALAPRAFFVNVFVVSMLNRQWLHQIGMFHNKLGLTLSCITRPGYLVLIVVAAILCVAVVWKRRSLTISNAGNLLLAVFLVPAFFVIALIMPMTWRQHLAMPVPFLVISFAYPLLYLRKFADSDKGGKHFDIACVAITAGVFVAVVSLPVVLRRIPILFNARNWVPIRVHRISKDIAERTKSPKLVLTLAPLYALEGGCDIYDELSAGAFVYRIADFMSPSDRELSNAVGPKTLGALLEKSPPCAVILGVEMEFVEETLFETAVVPDIENWERKVYDNVPIVYFKGQSYGHQ